MHCIRLATFWKKVLEILELQSSPWGLRKELFLKWLVNLKSVLSLILIHFMTVYNKGLCRSILISCHSDEHANQFSKIRWPIIIFSKTVSSTPLGMMVESQLSLYDSTSMSSVELITFHKEFFIFWAFLECRNLTDHTTDFWRWPLYLKLIL